MSQTQNQNGGAQSQSQSQDTGGPRTLSIRHVTRYDYTPPAGGIVTRMRLWPTIFDTQAADAWSVTANGERVTPALKGPFGVQEGRRDHPVPLSPADRSDVEDSARNEAPVHHQPVEAGDGRDREEGEGEGGVARTDALH